MSLDHILPHTWESTPPECDDCTATLAAEESIDIDTHPQRGDMKSKAHATSLATPMQDSQFDPRDLVGFNAHVENV